MTSLSDNVAVISSSSFDGCCLRTYLSQVDELRANYASSLEMTQYLLQKNISAETLPSTPPLLPAPPFSELHRASHLYYAALDDSRYTTSSTTQKSQMQRKSVLGPEAFVGKPLQLFCPLNHSSYTGRILNWRSCSAYPRSEFFGNGRLASCEFLVRWILPDEERVIHEWIVLEEHAVAVGVALLWAMPPVMTKKTGTMDTRVHHASKWKPAFLLLRSALEIVPWRRDIVKQGSWGLVSFLERCSLVQDYSSKSMYIDLEKDAVDFLSPSFREARQQECIQDPPLVPKQQQDQQEQEVEDPPESALIATMNKRDGLRVRLKDSDGWIHQSTKSKKIKACPLVSTSSSTPLSSSTSPMGHSSSPQTMTHNTDLDPYHSLAIQELEEQRRIFYWHTLPLVQANHPMALRLLDESMIPPLLMNRENRSTIVGVDRLWLTQIIAENQSPPGEEKPSLDQLASMILTPVQSIPKAMTRLHVKRVHIAGGRNR